MLARMWKKGTPWECNMEQSQLRKVWKCLKKLKTELPYNQAIWLLGMYLKKMKSLPQRGISTLMFTAPLFITAKIRKQLKYPRWMDKENLVLTHAHEHMYTHTHTRILLSHKRIKFCHLQQYHGPWQHFAKGNNSRRKKTNTIQPQLHVEYKISELTETDSRLMVARGWGMEQMGRCWSKGKNFQL